MSSQTLQRQINVLLVEDNPGDVELTHLALEESRLQVNLSVVDNGVAALDFLCKAGIYANAPRPDLLLLDLNLPKKSGHEVLFAIKHDKNLRRIPVIILTSSRAEEDILQSYNLYANCYITKPGSFEQLSRVIQSLEDYWFSIVQLPPN